MARSTPNVSVVNLCRNLGIENHRTEPIPKREYVDVAKLVPNFINVDCLVPDFANFGLLVAKYKQATGLIRPFLVPK